MSHLGLMSLAAQGNPWAPRAGVVESPRISSPTLGFLAVTVCC